MLNQYTITQQVDKGINQIEIKAISNELSMTEFP